MQSTEIKTILASCFFTAAYHFSLCYTLCPELWPLLSFSCCSAPKKHNCDLHCPKNNNNNNINLAAELLQSGYHRAQRTAPIRNSTAEICLSYFSTNRAIPSVTYYNMNNQTWQMEHKYTKTTMLKLTVKHLLLFNITTWHATLGTQTVGTNWQLDSNLKKHPLKKVVSACCCPSSWTQLWTWEQCLFFFFPTVCTETTCDVLTQSLKLGTARVTSRKNRCTRAFLADSRLSGS